MSRIPFQRFETKSTVLNGKIYFGGQTDTPTISGTTTSVGFPGLSSITRTGVGTYTLTFDRYYNDMRHFSYGNFGADADHHSGISAVISGEQGLRVDGTCQLNCYTMSGVAVDPVNQGLSLRFEMQSNQDDI